MKQAEDAGTGLRLAPNTGAVLVDGADYGPPRLYLAPDADTSFGDADHAAPIGIRRSPHTRAVGAVIARHSGQRRVRGITFNIGHLYLLTCS